ncbi:MAG: DUF1697 domain-containing protein [Saprospiraceae bacterium]|nr:DUF1697 domain-containing protein [Saprospiraceae bacterium]MCF8250863.1 DUF1697 domain-containing protein [Saprospiraceae bacterium]MCF8280678.1 DUF1697 domain-containing protein [Bacteroidales bacterium]MCF8312736.1 DUF1697 domain-containing protein [Saprospiraceae bacterium]MCF8441183.1 DUF1697 domain-containing protein [Saprospiraceae bacterium]
MTEYIAFLRGINVGKIRIKMTDLKSAFENMGCQDVKTYLQTGNVVFLSDKTMSDLKSQLEKGLSEAFKYEAYVLLYDFNILSDIIEKYPMERDETHHAYVVFIDKIAVFEELKTLAAGIGDASNYLKFGDNILYWKVLIGQSLDTPFSKILAKAKYKSSVTVRNLNTLEKMV